MSVLSLLRSDPEARTGERLSKRCEPTREIAQFLPKQGEFAASPPADSVLLPRFHGRRRRRYAGRNESERVRHR